MPPQMPKLNSILWEMGQVGVAVSGGIDSLTLATLAHRTLAAGARMFHATSPAVPAEATERVHDFGLRQGWQLVIFDAGEFNREEYRSNPVNRCFYCKTSLYAGIKLRTNAQLVSGTNLDDLGQYRPGLDAARDHDVRHPFVEAGIDKQTVRAIARYLGLDEVAELPAAPCLSSRVETGIPIRAEWLSQIHAAEKIVSAAIRPQTVRCRLRATGMVIELDPESMAGLTPEHRRKVALAVGDVFHLTDPVVQVQFSLYRAGSAFLTAEP